MLVYLLLTATAAIGVLSNILNKKFQLGFSMDLPHFIAYNFINALIASVYFFVTNNFSIEMNLITFLYSFVYAIIVILSLVLGLLALSKVSISLSGITSTAGSMILSAVFGICFLDESLSFRLLLSVIFMLLAIVLPCFKMLCRGRKGALPICILLFVNSGASVICQKLYTLTPDVCSSQSFFLMTNLIIVAICILALLFLTIRSPESKKNVFHSFTVGQYGNIAARTILSNISSIIGILLIEMMDVSVYTVITSSVGVITGAILSKFYFKEYMTRENWLAVIFAIGAFIANQ